MPMNLNLQNGVNPTFGPNYGHQDYGQNPTEQVRSPFLKMDFPRFMEGDDPLGWVYKAEHYFEFFNIEDSKKVKMVSFHMEGEALQWFQWEKCLTNYSTWEDFIKILCQKFGPSEFEDSTENLVKLQQTGTLRDYILDFCRLCNRTKDISLTLLKSCFIGGLKAEFRHDVKLLKPKDGLEAFAFAQQIDANLSDLKVNSWHKPPTIQPSFQSLVLQNAINQVVVDNRPKFNNV